MARRRRLLVHRFHDLLALPRFTKAWALPLWALLGVARLIVVVVSQKRLAPMFGNSAGVDPWVPLIRPDQEVRAGLIGRTVTLVSRYTPWTSNCLPQAIVARLLLAGYGVPHVVFFGLRRTAPTGAIEAHAWVVAGPIHVTGGDGFERYTVVAMFASEPADGARPNDPEGRDRSVGARTRLAPAAPGGEGR